MATFTPSSSGVLPPMLSSRAPHLSYCPPPLVKVSKMPPVMATSSTSAKPGDEMLAENKGAEVPAAPKATKKASLLEVKKGQIVSVDKEKYLNSINYLSVGHPPYYKGLDYIYEDRGEVLDIRIFETGEHALVAWVGIPTAPAWLPTDMLVKTDKLDYERI